MDLENNRQNSIHEKGFNINGDRPLIYNEIKIGPKVLEDAILDLGALKAQDSYLANKNNILKAIGDNDKEAMRQISNYFYRVSGIYQKACNLFSNMYRYDWYIVPEIYDNNLKEEKIVSEFVKTLNYLDNSYIKKISGEIALSVIKNGAYYGYLIEGNNCFMIQELPIRYCRSRFFVGNQAAVEFNMKFFDDEFSDVQYRLKVLKMFPKEFQKGYLLYKQGKLAAEKGTGAAAGGWYMLDPEYTVKFSFPNGEIPLFINAIPTILDLDAAQDLDRRKQMQKLLKIIVQQLPLDKNGDLIFDIDEARDIHNNAVAMLQRTIGTDVLTTFTDVKCIDVADSNTTTATDDLERVERTVYNTMGISQNLFNTAGNLSLEKSILNDESSVRSLILQFNTLYDKIVQKKTFKKNKYNFRLYMLETTQYNYKELSKLYKEHVQIGYSKMLPQIALGHSQSAIINTAHFENEVLHLSEIMIPPLMSSTLNGEDILGKKDKNNSQKTQNTSGTEKKETGRPEKADDEKSDKTIQNQESMS